LLVVLARKENKMVQLDVWSVYRTGTT
jgi:hypothetical protein